jgi:triphosphatase
MATATSHQAARPASTPLGRGAHKVRAKKRFARPAAARAKKTDRAGLQPAWTRAAPVILKAGATVDDAIAAIMTAGRAHFQANLAAALDGRAPEGVHQVRVALRRLRSALTIFKKYIPAAQRTWLRDEAKALLTLLGPVRDLDVLIHELAAPVAKKVSEDAGLATLMRGARAAQTKAHTAAVRALQGPRTGRLMARLDAWIAGRGWLADGDEKTRNARSISAEDFARRTLNRRLRKIHAEYDDIEALTVDERHELRIAVKKVRYGVEFLASVLPEKRVARLSAALKHLQDNLGHLNDLDVAERTVTTLVKAADTAAARRQITGGGKAVSCWHSDAAAKAEPETVKLWRKLKKLPPL